MRAKRSIEDLLGRIQGVRDQFKDYNLAPDHVKRDTRLYAMREAAELIGRSDQTIRDAEAEGILPTPQIGAERQASRLHPGSDQRSPGRTWNPPERGRMTRNRS